MFSKLHLSLKELTIFSIILILHVTGIFLSRTNPASFENEYVIEDGPIEWLTVVGLIAGIIVCIYRGINYKAGKNPLFFLATFGLAFMLFFIAGEEISWGQRILDIEAGKYFKENNTQGEMNVHNLKIGEVKLNRVVFSLLLFSLVALYLISVPLLYRYNEKAKALFDSSGILVPKRFHLAGFLMFFLLTELVPHGKKAELMEFACAFMFLLIIWFPSNNNAFQNPVIAHPTKEVEEEEALV